MSKLLQAQQGPSEAVTTPRRAVRVAEADALELDRRPARALAFGSQLLHGSVGLNAAQRVYEEAGVRLVRVPTILLSVMPHYDAVHHLDIPAAWLTASLDDLTRIAALADLELVTSGYLAAPEQTGPIARWLGGLPQNARPPFVLDPTLGDTELGFYTDPGLVAAIRNDLLPLATGVTPNLFELAQLSGTPLTQLTSPAAIEAAARALLGPRTAWVVVTGLHFPGSGDAQARVGELLVRPDAPTTVHAHAPLDTTAKGLGDTFTAALNTALLTGIGIAAAVDAAAAAVRAAAPISYPEPPTTP